MESCPKCGEENPEDARFCGRCGEPLRKVAPVTPDQPPGVQPSQPLYDPPYELVYYPQYAPRTGRQLAFAGGILVLIGGVVALVTSILLLVYPLATGDYYPYGNWVYQMLCDGLGLAFSFIAVFGGISAIKKRNLALAIVGAVFCMFSFGGLGVSSILGLIGLIFIAVSSHEFG